MLLKDINTNDRKFSEYSSVPLVGGDVCAYRIVLKTEFDLTGCRASVSAKRSDGRVFTDVGEVNKNLAVYIINSNMYSVAGEVCIRMNVISNDGSTVTDKEMIFNAVEEFGIGDMCTEDGRSIVDVFTAHMENTSNPHGVTADQLGLGDVQDKIKMLEKNKLSYTIAASLPDNAYLGINCAYFVKYNKNDYDAVDNPNAVGYRMYMGVRNNNTYVWSMIGEVDNKSITSGKIADNAVISSKIAAYSVTNAKIASGAVNTDKIYDKSVTSAKLADGSVGSVKIASGAVTGDKIASGAVTVNKIASGAVSGEKIASGAVSESRIASKAVTSDKIADKTIKNSNLANKCVEAENLSDQLLRIAKDGPAKFRPYRMSRRQYFYDVDTEIDETFYIYNDMDGASSHIYAGDDYGWDIYEENAEGEFVRFQIRPGEIYGVIIYSRFVTGADPENGIIIVREKVEGIDGSIIIDDSIVNSKLVTDAVDEYKIKDNSVKESKIASGAVTGAKIASGAVSSDKLSDGAVTSMKIASGAVNSFKLTDGAVTNEKIALGAVNSSKLADGSVISAKIASNAVSGGKLTDGAVTNTKIASGAVSSDKLTDGAVTNIKIASGAVSSDKLADGAVTNAKIADKAVTSDKIADSAVNNRNLAYGSVKKVNLSEELLRVIKDGPAKYCPYNMSGYQRFYNIEDGEIFYIYNDNDGASSFINAADDYGWRVCIEDADGEIVDTQVGAGEIHEVYIYSRFVPGADYVDGILLSRGKVDSLDAKVIKNGSITGNKLENDCITHDKIAYGTIVMGHLSPELRAILAKIK